MCAINGFNFKNEDLICRMNTVTAHRGPDGSGIFLDDNISLGHDRLSIIDLSVAAGQPMRRNGRYSIVFNGEIYNYLELKVELKNSYKFSNQSDTEVILAAYQKWGRDCVKKFNGIFAFAIWDAQEKELFLARDHIGVKPLYYFFDGQKFIFASEIKAILEHNVPRSVDREAFNFYFHLYYVPEPLTMFSGIKKLPAASYASFKSNKLVIEKYWEVSDFTNLTNKEEAREKIRIIFNDSVKHQLIADRPVGIFLSGGIDSTAVLGAASAIIGNQIKTFSVGFNVEDQADKFNADFNLARQTAKYYNTEHYELLISGKDILNNLDKIVWHLDEPNFNPTAGAMFLLSKMAKREVAVVLGGDGGDELFGGYPRYYASRLISYFQKLPKVIQKIVPQASKLRLGENASRVMAFLCEKQSELDKAINQDLVRGEMVAKNLQARYFGNQKDYAGDFEKLFMNLDRQSWLVVESLNRSDKMTMSQGLEARVPILDYRLVELSMRIPTAWKFNLWGNSLKNFKGKNIWREAIREYLPTHVLAEKKRGWFTPMAKWLRTDLKDFATSMLSKPSLSTEYFNAAGVQEIWQNHLRGKQYNLNLIWAIIMWQLWHDKFIAKK